MSKHPSNGRRSTAVEKRPEIETLRRAVDGSASGERKLLRAMINQVPDYLFIKDMDCRFVMVNEAVARIHNFDRPEDIVGKTDFDLHAPDRAAVFCEIEREVIRTGMQMVDMEEEVIDAVTGATRWLTTTKVAMRNEQGDIVGLIGISRDVSARKRAERLREAEAVVLEMIATNAPLQEVLERIVLLTESQIEDVFGSILLLDETQSHLRQGAAPTLPHAFCRALDGMDIGPNAASCGTAAYRRRRVVVTDMAKDPLWADYREVVERYGLRSCWSFPVISHDGAVLGTFAMYSRSVRRPGEFEKQLAERATQIAAIAIERKRTEAQINFLAHHDQLTGLPNRTLLKDRLAQAMLQTERHNPWVSVVFIDLDNFKSINDSLGHSTGDRLLRIMAHRLVACVRSIDAVIRLGGDEFVILLVDLPDSADALSTTLERIRTAVAEPLVLDRQSLHITCSMGIATFPHDGADPETLLSNADAAMYQAKEAGRDNFQFFTVDMNKRAHERLALKDAMRAGIARSEFYLLYQPQVDLPSGRIFAAEALVRWNHPTRGMIPPNDFIPLAEETGLIVSLGEWVLREACRQNKAWQDAGLPPITVCVNVSARQFNDKEWTNRVVRALEESGLEARYLELELTESLVMRDVQQAIATMNELQALGVQFAIDDFGTGYSSLSALKSLPVSRLKIDQSFVRNLASDEDDRSIAAAVISLGQRLNMKVIAEGVETDAQLAILRDSQCDEIQGYHFSRPIDSAAIEDLMKFMRSSEESGISKSSP